MTNRLKIFISAYACEPNLGSEIGVGWHWVLEMSKYFDLWVLTRKSNQHTIEPWIEEHPEYNHIHFLYFDLPQWARFWKKGLRGVRTYYNIWQWCTDKIVKRTMQENDIQIFHHLTYGNVLWGVSSYGQKQFFIWGPVGGLETIPEEYITRYDRKEHMVERFRSLLTKTLRLNTGYRKRCRNGDLILCKTRETYDQIPNVSKGSAVLFTDVAVDVDAISSCEPSPDRDPELISYLAVGRLSGWRGFDLLLEAFSRAVKENKALRLTILGKGSDRDRLESLIDRLSLTSYVSLPGQVSMESYYQYLTDCDVVVNPSLKEGAVTTSFDSLSFGKPLICIDTGGYTRYFKDDYALVIPRTTREEVINALSDGILRMSEKNIREQKGSRTRQVCKEFSWENHGKEIRDLIQSRYKEYTAE